MNTTEKYQHLSFDELSDLLKINEEIRDLLYKKEVTFNIAPTNHEKEVYDSVERDLDAISWEILRRKNS